MVNNCCIVLLSLDNISCNVLFSIKIDVLSGSGSGISIFYKDGSISITCIDLFFLIMPISIDVADPVSK